MDTAKRIEEEAMKLAVLAHCRYCGRLDDPRLKCGDDIEDDASEIANFVHAELSKAQSQLADLQEKYSCMTENRDNWRAQANFNANRIETLSHTQSKESNNG